MKGRPKGTVKYKHPITNEPIGVYQYRALIRQLSSKKRGRKNKIYLPEDLEIKLKNLRDKSRNYYYTHKEYFKDYGVKNRLKNKDKLREYFKELSKTPERKEYKRNQWKKHKEKYLKIRVKKSYGLDFEDYKKMVSKCPLCGFNKYPCDIHHKDKNKKNNNINNLIGLCPSCHMGIHRGYIVL